MVFSLAYFLFFLFLCVAVGVVFSLRELFWGCGGGVFRGPGLVVS